MATLVFRYKRWWGLVVAAGAIAIDWARVAAHVHHAQDVVAGACMGVAAGVLAVWIVHVLMGRLASRGVAVRVHARTTADRDERR